MSGCLRPVVLVPAREARQRHAEREGRAQRDGAAVALGQPGVTAVRSALRSDQCGRTDGSAQAGRHWSVGRARQRVWVTRCVTTRTRSST